MTRKPHRRASRNFAPSEQNTSWDPVAAWYSRWVGKTGSDYHRKLAVPALLNLLDPQPRETLIDLGCGTGILASFLPGKTHYIGVDLSPRLLSRARQTHGKNRTFLHGDATRLSEVHGLHTGMADAVVFLLSIQDMTPLEGALQSAAWVLRKGGRLVILMFHPCFRVPRQSGWGWDEGRKLQYRRIDSYMTHREVPVRPINHGKPGSIKAYHRPLEAYINGLTKVGLQLIAFRELPANPGITRQGPRARAENQANREIPLFCALAAVKAE